MARPNEWVEVLTKLCSMSEPSRLARPIEDVGSIAYGVRLDQ